MEFVIARNPDPDSSLPCLVRLPMGRDGIALSLPAGDYAVEADGRVVAAVERKPLADLVPTLTGGRLRYLLADLATVLRAALVVEDRWSAVFRLQHVRPAVVAEGLAESQVRFPTVPILFAQTRPLAQEWTYRFLGAAVAHHDSDVVGAERSESLPVAGPVGPAAPTVAVVRRWVQENGIDVADRGRLRAEVWQAYSAAVTPS